MVTLQPDSESHYFCPAGFTAKQRAKQYLEDIIFKLEELPLKSALQIRGQVLVVAKPIRVIYDEHVGFYLISTSTIHVSWG